ncbi:MAG: response regulator [Terriglobales bacterium]
MARKILLADDSVTAQNMGRKILTDAGYDVVTVNNGSAALKRIAESTPDLIILDVYMPGYSGLEVCQRLKEAEETAHIPILLSVGKLEPFKPQEARRVRADSHIVKPFEASQLLTAIARLEDAMVPQPHKAASRFASAGTSDEPFARPEDRILGRGARFSGARKKDAADSSSGLSPQAASFRDFRKKAQASAPEVEPVAEAVAQESASLSKLPRDITLEELSALSEVAAKLNEVPPATPPETTAHQPQPQEEASSVSIAESSAPAPVASVEASVVSQAEQESASSPVHQTAPAETAVAETAVAEAAVAETAVVETMQAETGQTETTPSGTMAAATTTSESAEQAEVASSPSEPATISAVAQSEIEIPVAQVEPAPEFAAPENSQIDQPQESEVPFPEPVSAASFAEEPAPVDQRDEPIFAELSIAPQSSSPQSSAAQSFAAQPLGEDLAEGHRAEEHRAEEVTAAAQEVKTNDAETNHPDATKTDATTEEYPSIDSSFAQPSAEGVAAHAGEFFESGAAEFCAVEGSTSHSISAEAFASAAGSNGAFSEPEAPMPSDAELAEALRLLTPAVAPAQSSPISSETPVETAPTNGHWSDKASADEETMELPAGRRWVAEALELTPEEAALSLEAEMFRAFAANVEKIESIPVEDPVRAIQTAVEKRIAEEVAAAESAGESAPKAMAAIAPNGHSTPAADEIEIASIVDKVMADLRPRIVEEIARKLAGK